MFFKKKTVADAYQRSQYLWHKLARVEVSTYVATCGFEYDNLNGGLLFQEVVKNVNIRCDKCK